MSELRSRAGRVLLGLGLVLLCAAADDDRPAPPVEVHEWSIWVGSPSQNALNGVRTYRNAMPSVVGTTRPKVEEKELAERFPIAPVSVVQFFGEPAKDLDVDLRVKKGAVAAHWPPAAERAGRLQWFKSDVVRTPPAEARPGFLPETHWFQKLREVEKALYHVRESRSERFLAYDAEVSAPIPLKVRGGPEEYILQNQTGRPLKDVALIVPTEAGFRVGWLDELPSGLAEGAKEEKKKDEKPKKSDKEKAGELFEKAEADAKKTDKEKDDEPKPLPPEGDANIKARVDQLLNRSISVNVASAPRKEVLDFVTGQARLRYELDEKTLAKEKVDLGKTMTLKAPSIAARDALAEVLGEAGLSYRVTEDGTLFVTSAARLADAAGKKDAAVDGPPVKLTLSQPLKPDNPSYTELTRDSYARRLARQGLREEAAAALLDQYGDALFRPTSLIVLAHYSRDALDEAVTLDVFPTPKTFVRVAALVVHGVDPRLQDRARELVAKLGDDTPKVREDAEKSLYELGPVAVPVLEDALRDKDLEVVFRAERLLLRLNRQVP